MLSIFAVLVFWASAQALSPSAPPAPELCKTLADLADPNSTFNIFDSSFSPELNAPEGANRLREAFLAMKKGHPNQKSKLIETMLAQDPTVLATSQSSNPYAIDPVPGRAIFLKHLKAHPTDPISTNLLRTTESLGITKNEDLDSQRQQLRKLFEAVDTEALQLFLLETREHFPNLERDLQKHANRLWWRNTAWNSLIGFSGAYATAVVVCLTYTSKTTISELNLAQEALVKASCKLSELFQHKRDFDILELNSNNK